MAHARTPFRGFFFVVKTYHKKEATALRRHSQTLHSSLENPLFGLNKKKPYGELKLDKNVNRIDIELLAGDLPFHREYLNSIKESLSKEELFGADEKGFCTVTIGKESIHNFINVWYSLTKGEPMRCFTPGYRITFYADTKVYKVATVCWACNHIKIQDNGSEDKWFTVDGEAKQAQKLLNLCRSAVQNVTSAS